MDKFTVDKARIATLEGIIHMIQQKAAKGQTTLDLKHIPRSLVIKLRKMGYTVNKHHRSLGFQENIYYSIEWF